MTEQSQTHTQNVKDEILKCKLYYCHYTMIYLLLKIQFLQRFDFFPVFFFSGKERLRSVEESLKVVPHSSLVKKKSSPKRSRRVTFHDNPFYIGYMTDIEDTNDEEESQVEETDYSSETIFFKAPLFFEPGNELMSIEEDLIGYANDDDDEEQSSTSSSMLSDVTKLMKDVVARGIGFIYTKSVGLS